MEYKLKPNGYKTKNQWLKEGKVPINDNVEEKYCCVTYLGDAFLKDGKPVIYKYISPDNVIDIEKLSSKSVFDYLKENDDINTILKDIVVFDTETTGFSKFDDLLQISCFNGLSEPLLDTFVHPIKRKTWIEAEKVNHISPYMVENAPYPKDIKNQIKQIFDNAKIIVGHNLPFDVRFVKQTFDIDIPEYKQFDTLAYFKEDKKDGYHKLKDAITYYCPDIMEMYEKNAHLSNTDALATLEVFKIQANDFLNKQIDIER